ncbi:thioredoxin-like protein [Sugiyamaella lignohabitans]|uniref:Thioredoxin-like protein n=1 Tax=Sugiyamaella lignohabitans TaxID=796027 RepID=A0A167CZP7_9ASCO|nr:thioredoxin-like protein [Sugiyamaella lignohabitans]ANB12299.1 thioredoxin-like protein [Sugiyamaella lignohabitans]
MPTFVYFHKTKETDRVRGATPEGIYKSLQALSKLAPNAVRSNAGESGAGSSSSGTSSGVPEDIKQILTKTKLESLNDVLHFGEAEVLNIKSSDPSKDLRELLDISPKASPVSVQSDADSQILIYLPLQNKAKVHSIYIKSTLPSDSDDSEEVQTPSTIKVWANLPSTISFDDATDGGIKPLFHSAVPEPDANGWREIPLRYVHFQNVTSLQIFLDGDDEDAATIVNKILIVGSKGENREQGKIEKIE